MDPTDVLSKVSAYLESMNSSDYSLRKKNFLVLIILSRIFAKKFVCSGISMASGTESVEGENSFLQGQPVEMVELLAKAFKDVPSHTPVGRLFAIVDKWLLKCSCDRKNNETEEFITTYTSRVRNTSSVTSRWTFRSWKTTPRIVPNSISTLSLV